MMIYSGLHTTPARYAMLHRWDRSPATSAMQKKRRRIGRGCTRQGEPMSMLSYLSKQGQVSMLRTFLSDAWGSWEGAWDAYKNVQGK